MGYCYVRACYRARSWLSRLGCSTATASAILLADLTLAIHKSFQRSCSPPLQVKPRPLYAWRMATAAPGPAVEPGHGYRRSGLARLPLLCNILLADLTLSQHRGLWVLQHEEVLASTLLGQSRPWYCFGSSISSMGVSCSQTSH